ncbi:MAG: hypothetical protein ABIZ57_10360, partial [Candidatus Limnocylindria bacterium]
VTATTDLDLTIKLIAGNGTIVASTTLPCAVLPDHARSRPGRHVSVSDPSGIWDLADCLISDGHSVTEHDAADLIVASRLQASDLELADDGAHLLLLVRSADALTPGLPLGRPVAVQPRWPDPTRPGADLTWSGDWISSFSWILPGLSDDLPRRAPLDFVYAQVLPDQVLCGYDATLHADEVSAGMFVGWIHDPVALIWSFSHGHGRVTVTTLKVAPERGPIATVLRDALIAGAARY